MEILREMLNKNPLATVWIAIILSVLTTTGYTWQKTDDRFTRTQAIAQFDKTAAILAEIVKGNAQAMQNIAQSQVAITNTQVRIVERLDRQSDVLLKLREDQIKHVK